MAGGLLGGQRDDRNLQAAADCVSDLAHPYALFGDRVIAGSTTLLSRPLLQRQPVKRDSIAKVDCGPAVEPFADIRRNALLASESDRESDQAMLDPVVDL